MTREHISGYIFPVLYSLFFIGYFFSPSTKALSNFYYIFVAAPFLAMVLLKKVDFFEMFASKAFVLSGVFLLYLWMTLFWAKDFNISDILRYGRRALYIICFMAATIHLIRSYPDFLRRLLVLFCWTAAIVSVVYSTYYYTRNPFPDRRLLGYGLLFNPIQASSIYGLAFIGCLYLADKGKSKTDLFINGVLLIPIFSYMLFAQARGPLIAILSTVALWQAFLIYKNGFKRGISANSSVLLICLFFVVAALFAFSPEFFRKFILGRGDSYRLEIWIHAMDMIKVNPFFGYGLNAESSILLSDGKTMLHPHSIYMATFYYGGLIGLILQIFLIGYCLFTSASLECRQESFLITFYMLFGSICIATDGNYLIQHPKPFWIFFWFPIALAAAFEINEKDESSAKTI